MKKIALYNLKGGVGKTTSTINLAYYLTQKNLKVLIWDLDPQGAASYFLEKKTSKKAKVENLLTKNTKISSIVKSTCYDNLYIIPGDLKNRNIDLLLGDLKKSKEQIKTLIKGLYGTFDVLLIDTPPALSLLSENIIKAVDFVLMPVIPSPLSIRSYDLVQNFFKENGYAPKTILPFFTMVDKRKSLHKKCILEFTEAHPQTLSAVIPYSSTIERMSVEQAPCLVFSPRTIPSMSYRQLGEEVYNYII